MGHQLEGEQRAESSGTVNGYIFYAAHPSCKYTCITPPTKHDAPQQLYQRTDSCAPGLLPANPRLRLCCCERLHSLLLRGAAEANVGG